MGARERESYGPSALEVLPIVRLAPSYFEIENTEGNAETWENFGKWYYELGKDAKSLSKAAKTEIDNIIADKATEQEKVNALFRYMQNKTRYVSIQLGIGGWKPFPAEYVFTNEYGDCKALTNYMQSILEYAGIKSNAVLINSGISEAPLRVDFPSNQFNHVILRVELSNGEIIWLECTSKYYPPGHIGSGNEDKNALMVTKEGGVIVKTPSSEANENVTSIYSNISLKDDGGILMNSKVTNTGIQQEYLLNSLLSISENAKVEWLEERFPQSNHSLLNVDFTGVNPKGNSVSYSYEAEFENYASSSSSRIYVPLKTSNSWNFNPQIQENRDHEISLGYKFAELDTVLYELPEGYKIESMPDSKIIEEDFGLYEINFTLNNSGNLELNRYLAIKEKTVPAEQYENFRNFFREVSNLDNSQLILVRK